MVSLKWLKHKTNYTVLYMRKGRSGRKIIVRTARNIAAMGRFLKNSATKEHGKHDHSAKRQTEAVYKSSSIT